jgi:putative ABC transport system permease protein
MNWVALKMLTSDKAKYFGIVFGVSFAALLMAQQSSIFAGLMRNTTSQIRDVQGADLWVMDPNVQFVDDVKPLSENDLYRVRGVPGVKWAVRLYKGQARARLADGNFQQMLVLGVDNATLVGAPPPDRVLAGNIEDLRAPDAVFIDEFGWRYLFGNEPFVPGAKTLEMNDKRAVVVGLCKCNPTFMTFPILYCTYTQAVQFIPQERKTLSFVLAKVDDGVSEAEVGRRVKDQTGLKALTNDEFFWTTIGYYLRRTGIPINFGITVGLGFVVGCAIAGQTFYLFTVENLKQFGALKAMGVGNGRLVGMILLQALVVGVIGYGIGVGGAALFGYVFERVVTGAPPSFHFAWQILVITGAAVLLIVTLAAVVSMRRVLFLEAGVVFR